MTARVDLALIRECLAQFSSEDKQRRLWLSAGQQGRDVGSFAEAYCGLFDDSCLGPELESGGLVFDEATDTALRRLDSLLEQIDNERSAPEVISDPAMAEVRVLARSLLERLLN